MKKILVFLFVSILSLFLTENVFASRIEVQKDQAIFKDFSVGPTSFSLEGKSGDTFTKTIEVTNRSGEEQKYVVVTEDFEGSHDGQNTGTIFKKEGTRYGAHAWAKTELQEFTLKHGERIFFDVTITIPEKAEPGDHYVAVLISSDPKKDNIKKGNANINVISRTGPLFFVKVDGAIIEDGELTAFETKEKSYYKAPIIFNVHFLNKGTVRLTPSGFIKITDMFGREKEAITIESFNVLRDSLRSREIKWKEEGFLFGTYTATLELHRGYGDKIDMQTIQFTVIPWDKIIGGLFIIGLIIFLIRFIKNNISISLKKKK